MSSPKAEAALFGLFVALLLWIPIPNGSYFPDAAVALQVGIYAMLLGWLALWAAGRTAISAALFGAALPVGLLALWTLNQAFHVLPLSRSWLEVISPESARIHGFADSLTSTGSAVTTSLDPYASKISLLKTFAYAGTFFLTLALVRTRSRVRWLAGALVFGALAHSVYAVLMHLAGVDGRFFGVYVSHSSAASGFFWNRNHFAGYLEMTLALGIGLLIAGLSDRRAESWKQFARQTLEWMLSPKMILRLSLCVLVIALTTTHSRMGNTAFFASLLIAGVIGIGLSRHATRNAVLLLSSLVIIDLMIVGSWFGVDRLVQRIEQTTAQEVVDRETPAAHTLAMLERFPVLGTGPGTFYVAFEPFRPEVVVDYYNFAHNDYAQFASESGVLGLLLLGVFVLASIAAAVRAQAVRRDPLMRGISFASIMGVAAILIHSTADFNLQIPSNATYFTVLLALGWIALHQGREESASTGPVTARKGVLGRWMLVVLAACLLGWASLESWQAARAHWPVESGSSMLSHQARRALTLEDWTLLQKELQRAEALEPDNPTTQELLGLLAMNRPDDRSLLKEASARFERSLAMRPVSPNTWANLAAARYEMGDTGKVFREALIHAAQLGPSLPQVQRLVALYGLAVLEEVDQQTRQAIESMVAAGMRRSPADFLAIAERRGRLDVACRYLSQARKIEPRWPQLCTSAARKP